jgi:hypothetical protein
MIEPAGQMVGKPPHRIENCAMLTDAVRIIYPQNDEGVS